MSILCAKTERRVTYTAIYIDYFQRLHRCRLMMIDPNQDSSGRQQIPSFADIRSHSREIRCQALFMAAQSCPGFAQRGPECHLHGRHRDGENTWILVAFAVP